METKRSKAPYIIIVILLLVIIAILLFKMCSAPSESEVETAELSDGDTPLIGYQEGTIILNEEDAQKAALDNADAQMVIAYQNQALSTDGINFDCYFANPSENTLDMFFAVAEAGENGEVGDELFVSGLVRPGSLLDHIELTKQLPKGTHEAYLAMTQVEEDMRTIHGQNTFAIQLIVE